MGKVVTKIKVQNWADVEMLAAGHRKDPPRVLETEALVDLPAARQAGTGAVFLYLQAAVVRQLGLRPVGEKHSRTMSDRMDPPAWAPVCRAGTGRRAGKRTVFSPVDLEIQGRAHRFDVIEVPDTLPNIVGQIPLEALDWVVDLRNQKLIPNPEHKRGELCDEF
ncbi:MAG: hypothetical protein HY360_17535 [Verrucomicrobia bacterium]|nr:hypothetical protein [Verrucomicrobiota bacterium]